MKQMCLGPWLSLRMFGGYMRILQASGSYEQLGLFRKPVAEVSRSCREAKTSTFVWSKARPMASPATCIEIPWLNTVYQPDTTAINCHIMPQSGHIWTYPDNPSWENMAKQGHVACNAVVSTTLPVFLRPEHFCVDSHSDWYLHDFVIVSMSLQWWTCVFLIPIRSKNWIFALFTLQVFAKVPSCFNWESVGALHL